MTPPKITRGWNPGNNRTGMMTMLVDNGHERHYQHQNWYVADDEEAAANARFYGAAQKMAAALEAALAQLEEEDDPTEFTIDNRVTVNLVVREALLEAGYTDTEEDES
jgi:ribosome-binding ATPase YchF (GTP1/OBG family)